MGCPVQEAGLIGKELANTKCGVRNGTPRLPGWCTLLELVTSVTGGHWLLPNGHCIFPWRVRDM